MEIRLVHDVDVSTLHSILSSSTIFSKRNTGIILEQELAAYEEMCYKNIERCPKMQMEITEILLQDIYITPDPESRFLKAQTLVRKGKALRVCGVDGLRDCIECLSKAIIIMNEIEISGEMCSKAVPIYHQLGVTHCLRALCTQEAEPNSKRILEDVKAALKIWLNISYVDCNEEGNFYTLSDNIMVLLYNLLDLIQSKGFMELSNDAYQLLIRMFKLKSISVEKWLTLLWESRRLSHALCVLPVNEAFILKSQEFCELSTINSWIHNLQGNQSSLLDFQHNFSFLFANSRLNSCDDNRYFQTDITVEEVQKVARKLISNVSPKIESTFVAGYLYRDLSQRLMTNGRLIEALSFANETRDLHTKLFHSKFTRVRKQNEEPINIEVKKSAAREVMLFDSISRDLNDRYLSPWKVLQGFLESILQLGLIYEMMGNRTQAVPYFRWGWAISDSFQFPLFTFAFSSHLGGVYVKEGHWDSAEKELQCAKDILNSSSAFCCSKCLIVLEVTLYESLGDLYRTKPNNTCERHVSKEAVKKWYTPALEKLILAESRNGLSFPEEGSDETATGAKCAASKTCSCSIMNEAGEDIMKSMKRAPETKISGYQSLQNQHTGISNKSEANESVEENLVFDSSGMLNQKESVLKHFSNMRCWHCLPSEVLKSGLLYDLINLKWEFVRRKLSMKLLTQVASENFPNNEGE